MAKIVHASEDRLTNFFNRHKAELKGDKGDQGLQGIQGDRGTKGDKGDKGEKGEKGDKGDKGEKGEKGDRGERGLQGAQGVQGVQGLQGIQGEKGDKGDKGDKGEKGDSAVDYVAEEVAKEAARAKAAEELNAKAAANAKKAIDTHTANTDNPHGVTAAQIGSYTKAESDTKLAEKADKSTTLAGYGITDGATKASLAPEYSAISAYSVGAIVYHDGNIYQCKTEISDGGEAWNPAHWSEAQKLDDFFTNSNSLLTGTIDTRLPYPLHFVTDESGLLKDRAINTTILASVTVPDNFTDLLIRASVASSLSVTMPEAIATKYGDTFPGEAGEYLITITKTGAAEAYVRTIKLEEVA